MWKRKNRSTWKGLVAGLMGGLAASFAMNQFAALGSKIAQSRKGGKRKQQGENEDATMKLAERVSEGVFHHRLTGREKKWAGPVVHYTYGALAGGLYGALAERRRPVGALAGLPYGAALWLLGDEVAVPLFRLSKSPTQYSVSTHAWALASHAVYGTTADLVRRLVRRAL
jgi:putative membrane protein